jgi:tRNA(Ile)-lysidine synthase
MSRLEKHVAEWRARHPGPLLIAVSGGPDSVALTCALAPLGDITLAHLNHQLRGAESDGDEAFVRDLACRLGVACITHAVNVAALAIGDNLEAVARRTRYAWLEGVARERAIGMVATGHTASDQAETVLHRIVRGTGLEGLRGIAAARPLSDAVTLVRPMLQVRRADVLAYLDEIGQPARHDSSNDDLTLTRNRLRHQLLPQLIQEYNPKIEEVLVRLAQQADEVFAEEEQRGEALLRQAECPEAAPGQVHLDAACLKAAPSRPLRAMLRALWRREGWPTGAMSAEHWYGVEAVCLGKQKARDLPEGITVRYAGSFVRLGRYGS